MATPGLPARAPACAGLTDGRAAALIPRCRHGRARQAVGPCVRDTSEKLVRRFEAFAPAR